MARSLVSGAVSMTMTLQRAPAFLAANATPCAALPALTVQTPLASSSGASRRTALYAPRILNDPIGCSVSSFRKISGPPGVRGPTGTRGVRTAASYTFRAASRIVSMEMARNRDRSLQSPSPSANLNCRERR